MLDVDMSRRKEAMTRIYVPMTSDEWLELVRVSQDECRHPREQARYLLRQALGLTCEDSPSQQKHNRAGAVIDAVPSAIAP
jgi:hypothetical protein